MNRWYRRARDTVLVGIAVALLSLATGCGYSVLTPARWRCGVHTYTINEQHAPPGAVQAVHTAFAALNSASGRVTWRYAPTGDVRVSWVNLAPNYWGQSAPQPWPNNVEWSGGVVLLDPAYPVRLGVIEHELGHIAGLGHSTDRQQLMYPSGAEHKSGYQAGDVAGLQQLASECRR